MDLIYCSSDSFVPIQLQQHQLIQQQSEQKHTKCPLCFVKQQDQQEQNIQGNISLKESYLSCNHNDNNNGFLPSPIQQIQVQQVDELFRGG